MSDHVDNHLSILSRTSPPKLKQRTKWDEWRRMNREEKKAYRMLKRQQRFQARLARINAKERRDALRQAGDTNKQKPKPQPRPYRCGVTRIRRFPLPLPRECYFDCRVFTEVDRARSPVLDDTPDWVRADMTRAAASGRPSARLRQWATNTWQVGKVYWPVDMRRGVK